MNTETIERLRAEAGAVGDMAQVEICERALAGDLDAIRECVRVIRDAAAMVPPVLGADMVSDTVPMASRGLQRLTRMFSSGYMPGSGVNGMCERLRPQREV